MAEVSPVRLNLNSPGQTAPQTIPPSTVIHGDNYTLTTVAGVFHRSSSPIVDDIDGDGKKETIFMSDAFALSIPEGNHLIYVLNPDGTIKSGWPMANYTSWGYTFPSDCTSGDLCTSAGKEIVLPNWAGVHVYSPDGKKIEKRGGDNNSPAIISNFKNPGKQLSLINGYFRSSYIEDLQNTFRCWFSGIRFLSAADINNDGEAEAIGFSKIDGYEYVTSSGTSIKIQKNSQTYRLTCEYKISLSCVVNNVRDYNTFYQGLTEEAKQHFPQGSEMESALHRVFDKTKDYQIHVVKADGTYVPGWPVELTSSEGNNSLSHYCIDIVAGDVDRDGKMEIFVSYPDNFKNIICGFKKNGEILNGWNKKEFDLYGTFIKIFLTNVINKDCLDVVLYGGGRLTVFDYQGNEYLKKETGMERFPIFVDTNGDGRSKMVYFGSEGNVVSVDLLNNRSSGAVKLHPFASGEVRGLAGGDIDSDGKLEFAVTGQYRSDSSKAVIIQTPWNSHPLPGQDWPMLNQNPERTNSQEKLTTSTATLVLPPSAPPKPAIITPFKEVSIGSKTIEELWLADLNKDGHDEIISIESNRNVSSWQYFLNVRNQNGQLLRGWPQEINNYNDNDYARNVLVSDYDKDGQKEIFAISGNNFRIYGADGIVKKSFDLKKWQGLVGVADFNGDSKKEALLLFVDINYGNSLSLFNPEEGNFKWSLSIPDNDSRQNIAFGNIDGDRNKTLEIVAGGKIISSDGKVTASLKLPTGTTLRAIQGLADVNNDGRLEILATYYNSDGGSFLGIFNSQGNLLSQKSTVGDYDFDNLYLIGQAGFSNIDGGVKPVILNPNEDFAFNKNILELNSNLSLARQTDLRQFGMRYSQNLVMGDISRQKAAIVGYKDLNTSSGARVVRINDGREIYDLVNNGGRNYTLIANYGQPCVQAGDLDGNGLLDVVTAGSIYENNQYNYKYQIFHLPETYNPQSFDWPMKGHDLSGSYCYGFNPDAPYTAVRHWDKYK